MPNITETISELDGLDALIEDGTLRKEDTLVTIVSGDGVTRFYLTVDTLLALRRAAMAGTELAKAVEDIEAEGCKKGHYPEDCYCDVESPEKQRYEALAAYRSAIEEKNV